MVFLVFFWVFFEGFFGVFWLLWKAEFEWIIILWGKSSECLEAWKWDFVGQLWDCLFFKNVIKLMKALWRDISDNSVKNFEGWRQFDSWKGLMTGKFCKLAIFNSIGSLLKLQYHQIEDFFIHKNKIYISQKYTLSTLTHHQ